jgi:hypothetical protein
MKRFLLLCWIVVLGVFLFDKNLDDLIFHHSIQFHWVNHPRFSDLFMIKDVKLTDPWWVFIKCGHFLGFSILELLLYSISKKRKFALIITILSAILSEILQLYFARDGRFLDMGIDSLGAFLVSRFQPMSTRAVPVRHGSRFGRNRG